MQYAGPSKLAQRQAIYAYRQPKIELYRWPFRLVELSGDETVIDVGCGNGRYLGELRRRQHRGLTLGVDLSAGMLSAVAESVPGQPVAQADATALPLGDGVADLCLAMHMLYHVPEPREAVAELRRVLRDDGCVLMMLNQQTHTAELRAVVAEARLAAGHEAPFRMIDRVRLDEGAALLGEAFGSVEVHEIGGELVVTDVEPVVAYAASLDLGTSAPDGDAGPVLDAIGRIVQERIAADGAFRIRTASGCIVARP